MIWIINPTFVGRSSAALLFDGEEFVRTSAADILRELGYAVVEAKSAEQVVGI